MGQFRMPQLTRPLRTQKGPRRHPPFRHGQHVIVSNDMVFLTGVILDPLINLNYDEILRDFELGVRLEIGNQEGFEAFKWDIANCNRVVTICHSKGIWIGSVHCTCGSGDKIELELREH